MSPHFFWYLARASGVVTFGLLTVATVWGLLISARVGSGFFERPWVFELHKFASLLAMAFLGVHMAVLVPDQWTDFTVVDLLVPGASAYRPAALALGIVAMYGSVVVIASCYVRRQIGPRVWRLLHYTTFATFFLALLHGVVAGTDASAPWLQLMYAGSGFLVSALVLYRLLDAEVKAVRAEEREYDRRGRPSLQRRPSNI